jgi:predicted secreted protein
MKIAYQIAVYFIIWWTVLFAILPFGIKSQHEGGDIAEGTDPGAPQKPQLLKKAIITTLVTSVVYAAFYIWMMWE